jgi:hypothetical protein
MRKLILLFITLTSFANESYASFPISSVVDTPVTDTTLNIETIEQYHLRIQKMGFDLSNCNCASCRNDIPIDIEGISSDATKWYLKGPMIFVWLIFLVSFVVLVDYSIIIYKEADNCSGCLA